MIGESERERGGGRGRGRERERGEGEGEREGGERERERCVINILTECVDIKVCYDTENKSTKVRIRWYTS